VHDHRPSATNSAASARHAAASTRGRSFAAAEHGWTGRVQDAVFHTSLRKGARRYARHWGVQCVTYARSASGIELSGNAANWWTNAEGLYARGSRPEPGSVLNFRATGHMRLGHVAVVSSVEGPRQISIDHANWAGPGASRGGVSRAIPVVDVSPDNDWSEVRVGLGHSGDFGSIYPTYGFIYPRPDTGGVLVPALVGPPPPVPELNPVPNTRSASGRASDRVVRASSSDAALDALVLAAQVPISLGAKPAAAAPASDRHE
jgi:surface antigen